jgi:DNA-damage-inducible protein D
MQHDLVRRLHKHFEDYVHVQDGVEFWFARNLQDLLGYTEWRNFFKVIEKARESCKNSDHLESDHFVDVNKMVILGSGSGGPSRTSIVSSRYARRLSISWTIDKIVTG